MFLEFVSWNEIVYHYLQTLKGWFFVGITALVLYFLLKAEFSIRDSVASSLKDSLEEKKILINEIHHRVKNNLNSVISFLTLQKESLSEESKESYTVAIQRVYSIALVHEFLYKTENYRQVDFGEFLAKLLESIRGAFGTEAETLRFVAQAENVTMDISKAVPCGILVNEVVTNSLKHAFPRGNSGSIEIEMRSENGKYCLKIRDDGAGIPQGWDSKKGQGLGLTLIQALAKQLSAKIEVDAKRGLEYVIIFEA